MGGNKGQSLNFEIRYRPINSTFQLISTDKTGIAHLALICQKKGIKKVVFSPGSRPAPLVVAFNAIGMSCDVIVDERSAAFFALGYAQRNSEPVALVCTSGTAALNYAPAIAEAYYQGIPLLVLTADRPIQWVDQADMQTLRQNELFANYIKKSFTLPQRIDSQEDLWFNDRIVNEAINLTISKKMGPVHINVPLSEPLYEFTPADTASDFESPKIINLASVVVQPSFEQAESIRKEWRESAKIMILAGQGMPSKRVLTALKALNKHKQVILLTEATANCLVENTIYSIDALIESLSSTALDFLRPEILVSFGGMVVSKKIKVLLRKLQPEKHWLINQDAAHEDTFMKLTEIIRTDASTFFELVQSENNATSSYKEKLLQWFKERMKWHQTFLKGAPYSDLKVFELVIKSLPENSSLQIGNSTPVRYLNLFDIKDKGLKVSANRGVGGIDGTVSTAVGAASASSEITTLIVGDLGFFYDSNGLWVKSLPNNLRILLINNNGGNIFRIIEGPEQSGFIDDFFEVKHSLNAKGIAQTFGVAYRSCSSEKELKSQLKDFFDDDGQARLLEVFTSGELSSKVLKEYFGFLKKKAGINS